MIIIKLPRISCKNPKRRGRESREVRKEGRKEGKKWVPDHFSFLASHGHANTISATGKLFRMIIKFLGRVLMMVMDTRCRYGFPREGEFAYIDS